MVKSKNIHNFSMIPAANIPRSKFGRPSTLTTTMDEDYLVPVFIDEVYPGDSFKLNLRYLSRLTTSITPFMSNLYMDMQAFFVPFRLLWPNWQRLCGEQPNPGDSTDFLIPKVNCPDDGWPLQSLADYFGVETQVKNAWFDAWPLRAYNLIFNEWYRDENLQERAWQDFGDGPDDPNNYKLLKRGKRHDYFTSCLPWPQKGPGVDLPLSGNAPIITTSDRMTVEGPAMSFSVANGGGTWTPAFNEALGAFATSGALGATDSSGPGLSTSLAPDNLLADLSGVSAVTINDLRTAFAIQRLFERDARGGTRYTEIIRSHFGVISPDARLQRPEYLGGFSSPFVVNTVVQNSGTSAESPQGTLTSFAVGAGNKYMFNKSFTEHGMIMILASIRSDLSYQGGIPRWLRRQTREDLYWPAFAFLGEQSVYNYEIKVTGDEEQDMKTFGFQERFAEMRYYPSKITGYMRSSAKYSDGSSATLDKWHLAQKFENAPVLNDEFIQSSTPINRITAINNETNPEPHFYLDMYFDLECTRPLPMYSVPGLIDHF